MAGVSQRTRDVARPLLLLAEPGCCTTCAGHLVAEGRDGLGLGQILDLGHVGAWRTGAHDVVDRGALVDLAAGRRAGAVPAPVRAPASGSNSGG